MKRRYKNLIEVWYDPNDNNKIVRTSNVSVFRIFKFINLITIDRKFIKFTEDLEEENKIMKNITEVVKPMVINKD